MIEAAIFSLIFLIIGVILGYLLAKGIDVSLPELKRPQGLSTPLLQRKKRVLEGFTGGVRPVSPRDLREKKEVQSLMEFQKEQDE